MIEVTFTYDFQSGIDEKAYAKLAREASVIMSRADGFIEFKANRNMVGSPHVRRSSSWKSLAHWAAFAQQPEHPAPSLHHGPRLPTEHVGQRKLRPTA